jgi:hypothetical protein
MRPIESIDRLLLPVVAEVGKGQDDDRQTRRRDGWRTRSGGRYACRGRAGYAFKAQRIDANRPRDVLDALLPHVLEGVREPVADMVADGARDADAARRRQPFQPHRDVDALAVDVVAVGDHVAEIDPDAKPQAALLGEIQIAVGHRALNFGRTAHRIDHARKFRQHAVAGGLDDPAVMLADLRIEQFDEMRLEPFVRAFLIRAHKRE